MKFFLFIITLAGGLLSFNSYANVSCPSVSVPFKYDPFLTHFVPLDSSHPENGSVQALDIHGCTYAITSNSCPENVDLSKSGSVCTATAMVPLSDSGDVHSSLADSHEAPSCPAGVHAPVATYNSYYDVKNSSGTSDHFVNLGGCEYSSPSGGLTADGSYVPFDDLVSTGKPAMSGTVPADSKEDKSSSGSGDDSSGSSDGGDASDVMPPAPEVNPPESLKPYPDHATVSQLIDLKNKCFSGLSAYENKHDDHYKESVDRAYNARAAECNAVFDKLDSLIPVGGKYTPDKSKVDFLTKNYDGTLIDCHPSVYDKSELDGIIVTHAPRRDIPKVTSDSDGHLTFDDHLNFNYTIRPAWPDYVCQSVANNSDNINSDRSDLTNDELKCPADETQTSYGCLHVDCPAGYVPNKNLKFDDDTYCHKDDLSLSGNPSSGTGEPESSGSGDKGNGDVVAAINAFHSDSNSYNKQLLDEIKKKDDYSDTTSKVGDLFTNGISEFKSSSESSVNSLIDGLDKYAPGLKGFGLPDGFYSGDGHCVPLDMSFTFTVPMVDYSVPVNLSTDNLCKFYDGYPRELLRMLIYMLTVFLLIVLLKQSLK